MYKVLTAINTFLQINQEITKTVNTTTQILYAEINTSYPESHNLRYHNKPDLSQ